MNTCVLSIFPGVGLLDRAFEAVGWCVVRGPDLLWGGDVRGFIPPENVFAGVIGGPPCQDFSAARRSAPTGYGHEMLQEFQRIVCAARPAWWLLENVPRCPYVRVAGYVSQRFAIDQAWFEPVSRLRHVQFGSRDGRLLDAPVGKRVVGAAPAALACDSRPWAVVRQLQGLPVDYDLPGFSTAGKVAAVGNGVPQTVGRWLALAVWDQFGGDKRTLQPVPRAHVPRCLCGCGRIPSGRKRYAGAACRKRSERARRAQAGVT